MTSLDIVVYFVLLVGALLIVRLFADVAFLQAKYEEALKNPLVPLQLNSKPPLYLSYYISGKTQVPLGPLLERILDKLELEYKYYQPGAGGWTLKDKDGK